MGGAAGDTDPSGPRMASGGQPRPVPGLAHLRTGAACDDSRPGRAQPERFFRFLAKILL